MKTETKQNKNLMKLGNSLGGDFGRGGSAGVVGLPGPGGKGILLYYILFYLSFLSLFCSIADGTNFLQFFLIYVRWSRRTEGIRRQSISCRRCPTRRSRK